MPGRLAWTSTAMFPGLCSLRIIFMWARGMSCQEKTSDMQGSMRRSTTRVLAWAACFALLAAGHLVMSAGNGLTDGPVASSQPSAGGGDPYLAAMLQPTRIATHVRPMIGAIDSADGTELVHGGNQS